MSEDKKEILKKIEAENLFLFIILMVNLWILFGFLFYEIDAVKNEIKKHCSPATSRSQ